MHEHQLITFILFTGFFLFTTSMLHNTTKRFALLPYTSALLLVGLITQIFLENLGVDTHIRLSPDIIFFILLPLLLFESAMHINLHQFRLQFKTITFLATFGLLVSIALMGISLAFFLGLPFSVALLFGAIISATDPIAVLSLFKTLGAPKRLGLLAEGESMFNDATAVIAFRTISTFALAGTSIQWNQLALSSLEFLYVTIGSVVIGVIGGYIVAQIIARINNDRLVETTLTIALALTSFVVAEHFFHLSGVICTVVAGITLGNLGRTKISGGVIEFMEELWEYLSFVAISLVFFFATFNLNMEIFNRNLLGSAIVILVMLLVRSLSVYLSFSISNTSRFFRNEPNVPLSWQHVINWGGMRGVIPLVLVYSLPDEFAFKQDFLSFTISAFLFTLFVNAVSIRGLLMKLGIHLPKAEEDLIRNEEQLIELAEAQAEIKQLPKQGFNPDIVGSIISEIKAEQDAYKRDLLEKGAYRKLVKSLKLQSLRLEAQSLKRLFHDGSINENVYFDLDSELDLQMDALEHPEVSHGRAIKSGGYISSRAGFSKRLHSWHRLRLKHPWLAKLMGIDEASLIVDRMMLLKTRILSSEEVNEHLKLLQFSCDNHPKVLKAISTVIGQHEKLIDKNSDQLQKLENKYPEIARDYQNRFLQGLVRTHTSGGAFSH